MSVPRLRFRLDLIERENPALAQHSPHRDGQPRVCALVLVVVISSFTAMAPRSSAETFDPATAEVSLRKEVSSIAALPEVHAAFSWFRSHQSELNERQLELCGIAAPPFGESARAEWLRQRFVDLGLQDVHIDEVGNVFGFRSGRDSDSRQVVAVTAHLDTVFPPGTAVKPRRERDRLLGPGIADNAAGLTALLAIAAAIQTAGVRTALPIVFIGNVGEEGEGDARGMRHIFSDPRWRTAIAYTIVIDGAGTDSVVTQALGSRRFEVTMHGPGGHSWNDFGVANPIVAMARAIDEFSRTVVPSTPKTTFNIGVISGGTSVNSIPESASMRVDLRSSSAEELDRLERILRKVLENAVREVGGNSQHADALHFDLKQIGNRPAAELSSNSRLLAVVRAVDEQLGNQARIQRASTDANIPLSLGHEALAIGAGGTGGGAHTVQEWYDPSGRDFGLKRILLSVLTAAGVESQSGNNSSHSGSTK